MNDQLRRYWPTFAKAMADKPQVLLVAAVLLALWPVLLADFVRWDDPQLITENPLVSNFSFRIWRSFDPELYIPLVFLSFQLQHLVSGFSPFAFHAGNLALHIGVVLLLYEVLLRLSKDQIASVIGALLFAVHPLVVEPVAWVSARKELLMALFVLLSVMLFFREEKQGGRWGSVAAFLGALLSKVTALVLPVLMAILFLIGDGKVHRESSKRLMPFFALSLLFGAVALIGKQHSVSLLEPFSIILLSARSFLFYAGKLIWPAHLSAIYPAPDTLSLADPLTIFAALFVIAFLMITIIFIRRGSLIGWALAWIILFLTPSFLSYEKGNVVMLAADRYMYLPLAGVALLVTLGLRPLLVRMPRPVVAVCTVILLALGLQSHLRTRVWANTETLFMNVLMSYPEEPIALNNIGFIRMQAGDLDGASTLFQGAIIGNPNYADAFANIGAVQGKLGNLSQAEEALLEAIKIDPSHLQASHSLAGISFVRGDMASAEKQYLATLTINPEFAPSLFQLAITQLRQGKRDDARATYQKLLSIRPDYAGRDEALDALLTTIE